MHDGERACSCRWLSTFSTVYSSLYKQYVNLSSLLKQVVKVCLVSIIQLASRFSNYTIWLSLLTAVAVFFACNILQIANISSFYSRCFTSAWSFFFFFWRLLKAWNRFIIFHLLPNITRYLHKHYSYTHPVHTNTWTCTAGHNNIIETNQHHFYMTDTGSFYKIINQNTICNCWSIFLFIITKWSLYCNNKKTIII